MTAIKLKDLLSESPDTIVLKDSDGTNKFVRYGGKETVVTGIVFNDPKKNTKHNYIALVEDPQAGTKSVVELYDQQLNEKGKLFLSTPRKTTNRRGQVSTDSPLNIFTAGDKGHSRLENWTDDLLTSIYRNPDAGKESEAWGHYDEIYRFRIFHVNNKYYFTVWSSSVNLYKENLQLFIKIIKDCGLNSDEMIWEVNTDGRGYERTKLVNTEDLHKLMGTDTSSSETQSEIQKRLSELSKKLSEMESDEHVKGATWNPSQKKRHKIDMINLESERRALNAARMSGETEIKNVIIKTIDSLSDGGDEIIPSEILYAELERKLSQYGTSVVAIIRNLRDKGIDIKKALREISDRLGGKASATELMEGLSKYAAEATTKTVNENNDNTMNKNTLKNLIRECLNEVHDENDVQYVEYLRQMNGEVPFMLGGQKFEYVWAKYPNGKKDIAVYAFAGDMVYGYKYFRKMYGINENTGKPMIESPGVKTYFHVDKEDLSRGSRNPDAEREIVYQVKRITSDVSGDDYTEEVVGEFADEAGAKAAAARFNQESSRGGKLAEDKESFSKTVSGTVNVNGEEFDYEATVSGNVVGTPQAHGEFHSEVDESSIDIDIKNVKPYPEDEQWKAIDSAVFDDVMGKNLWDLVNERQLKEICVDVKEQDWKQYQRDTDSNISWEIFRDNYEKCDKCGYCDKNGSDCQCWTR